MGFLDLLFRERTITRRDVERMIVRVAEQHPDTRLKLGRGSLVSADGCIMHTVAHRLLGPNALQYDIRRIALPIPSSPWYSIAVKVMLLNDAGNRWGDIPKLAGLVPGERRLPADERVPIPTDPCVSPVLKPQAVDDGERRYLDPVAAAAPGTRDYEFAGRD